MIELPTFDSSTGRLWDALLDIGEYLTTDWTLIGGQMVLLHALEHGTDAPRVSDDLDLLGDVRADPMALRAMSDSLRHLHFDHDGMSPEGIGHRYSRDGVTIDVLAPDGLGPKADLRTTDPAVTIEVSGGTFALARTELVHVRHLDRTGFIPRPDLAGALVVKAGAFHYDTGTRGSDRHLRDLAFLTSMVPDAYSLKSELGRKNCARLRNVRPLHDENSESWALLGDRRSEAFTTWSFLTT